MSLTIILLIKNNQETVAAALDSVLELNPKEILVGDLGSRDKTPKICEKFEARIMNLAGFKDRGQACNRLIEECKSDWMLYIHPTEILIAGHERIKGAEKPSYVQVLQGDLIKKQIRLFNKDKKIFFKNPVLETIEYSKSSFCDAIIWSNNTLIDNQKGIERWRSSAPLSTEPYYFETHLYLARGDYSKFLSLAKHYLFYEKQNKISVTMTRYYLASVLGLIHENFEEAIQNTLFCLTENILMAEFWCLLGDIFLKMNQFEKAISFYENAILLGSKRLKSDLWPMHISKYKEYPEEMIGKCKEVKGKTQVFVPI